jgi:hypothetical protein
LGRKLYEEALLMSVSSPDAQKIMGEHRTDLPVGERADALIALLGEPIAARLGLSNELGNSLRETSAAELRPFITKVLVAQARARASETAPTTPPPPPDTRPMATWSAATRDALGPSIDAPALERSVQVDVPGYQAKLSDVSVNQLPNGERVLLVEVTIHAPDGSVDCTVSRHLRVNTGDDGVTRLEVRNEDIDIADAHKGKGLTSSLGRSEAAFYAQLAQESGMPVRVTVQAAAPDGVYYWARRSEGYEFGDGARDQVAADFVGLTDRGVSVEHDGAQIRLSDPEVKKQIAEKAAAAKTPADFAEMTIRVDGNDVPIGKLLMQQFAGAKKGIRTWGGERDYLPPKVDASGTIQSKPPPEVRVSDGPSVVVDPTFLADAKLHEGREAAGARYEALYKAAPKEPAAFVQHLQNEGVLAPEVKGASVEVLATIDGIARSTWGSVDPAGAPNVDHVTAVLEGVMRTESQRLGRPLRADEVDLLV